MVLTSVSLFAGADSETASIGDTTHIVQELAGGLLLMMWRKIEMWVKDTREESGNPRFGEWVQRLTERHCGWLHDHSTQGCIVIRAIGEFDGHNSPIDALGRRLR